MSKCSAYLIALLCILLAMIANAETMVPAGYVSGSWNADGSPYRIQGEITIHADSGLVISPGVNVIFDGYYRFIVYGTLGAIGTADNAIVFTPDDTEEGWHGIRFRFTSAGNRLEHCVLEYGKATGDGEFDPDTWGGALFCTNSAVEFSNCIFRDNTAQHYGGAIQCYMSDATFEDCEFTNNTAGYSGGAVDTYDDCILEFLDCDFEGNSALAGNSGGIQLFEDCDAVITGCQFTSNTSTERGGAVRASTNSTAVIKSCLFAMNSSEMLGGALESYESRLEVSNCTFYGNVTHTMGGAYCIRGASNSVFVNNILWNNIPDQIGFSSGTDPSVLTVDYSNVEGGELGVDTHDNGTLVWGAENIDEPPCFVHPDTGNYRLDRVDSPCIDSGIDLYVVENDTIVKLDPHEYFGTAPDMGAFEYNEVDVHDHVLFTPQDFNLYPVYPNPFNAQTMIHFDLPINSNVKLVVYNILGEEVVELFDQPMKAGYHSQVVNLKEVSSGLYFCGIETENFRQVRKMTLMK